MNLKLLLPALAMLRACSIAKSSKGGEHLSNSSPERLAISKKKYLRLKTCFVEEKEDGG
jgi:hypothetical protein